MDYPEGFTVTLEAVFLLAYRNKLDPATDKRQYDAYSARLAAIGSTRLFEGLVEIAALCEQALGGSPVILLRHIWVEQEGLFGRYWKCGTCGTEVDSIFDDRFTERCIVPQGKRIT